MLESLGLGEAAAPDDADVVVFNTCTIREKPDTRLAAYLGNAGAMKRERPDVVVAVGGCYAEAQRERIFELYPFVDVAFGPGSIPHLGEWISAGGYAVDRGRFGTHEHFAADLPMHGERRFQAWVQVSMGCNSACAYCIVPAVRGREQSRRPGDIVAEVTRLADAGVREITLLGQNVNSWGRDLRPEIDTEFGELAPRVRRRARHRPDPLHEPAPEGLPRARRLGNRRVLRASASTSTFPRSPARRASSRRCAARTTAIATSGSSTRCATPFPTSRSAPISSSGSRARPSTTSRRRCRSSTRFGSTARSRSSTRRVAGTEAASLPSPVPDDVKHAQARGARRARAADRRRAQRGARRPRRGGPRRGAEPHGSGARARPHPSQHDRELRRRRRRRRARGRPGRGRDLDDAPRARWRRSSRPETAVDFAHSRHDS